jgi:hypothetical protein
LTERATCVSVAPPEVAALIERAALRGAAMTELNWPTISSTRKPKSRIGGFMNVTKARILLSAAVLALLSGSHVKAISDQEVKW